MLYIKKVKYYSFHVNYHPSFIISGREPCTEQVLYKSMDY